MSATEPAQYVTATSVRETQFWLVVLVAIIVVVVTANLDICHPLGFDRIFVVIICQLVTFLDPALNLTTCPGVVSTPCGNELEAFRNLQISVTLESLICVSAGLDVKQSFCLGLKYPFTLCPYIRAWAPWCFVWLRARTV